MHVIQFDGLMEAIGTLMEQMEQLRCESSVVVEIAFVRDVGMRARGCVRLRGYKLHSRDIEPACITSSTILLRLFVRTKPSMHGRG